MLWGAIVAEKKDQSVVEQVIRLERLQHLPDPIIQRQHHCRVLSPTEITNVRNAVHVGLRWSIIRGMHSVVGQIKKKRLRSVAVDKRNSLSRERIRQIVGFR